MLKPQRYSHCHKPLSQELINGRYQDTKLSNNKLHKTKHTSSSILSYRVVLDPIQSSSAAVLAAWSDRLRPHGSVQVLTLIQSSSADDQIRVETCTDPCGLNWSDEAASTAADDDQIRSNHNILSCRLDLMDPQHPWVDRI